MDLSQIPLGVLRAEVNAVEQITSPSDFAAAQTPICKRYVQCTRNGGCPLLEGECQGLTGDYLGWSERKEQYLLRIRAEIAERSQTVIHAEWGEIAPDYDNDENVVGCNDQDGEYQACNECVMAEKCPARSE